MFYHKNILLFSLVKRPHPHRPLSLVSSKKASTTTLSSALTVLLEKPKILNHLRYLLFISEFRGKKFNMFSSTSFCEKTSQKTWKRQNQWTELTRNKYNSASEDKFHKPKQSKQFIFLKSLWVILNVPFSIPDVNPCCPPLFFEKRFCTFLK